MNLYKILRGGTKDSRRSCRYCIYARASESPKHHYFFITDIMQLLRDCGVEVGRVTVEVWFKQGLFGPYGKKRKSRWAVIRKGIEYFLKKMEEVDDERFPYKNLLHPPRKPRAKGIKSKRELSLYARGLVRRK